MSSSVHNFEASGITARLFKIIEKMSEDEKINLLVLVGDQRQFTRTPYLMNVEYRTEESSHSDFILDISPGGTFIETDEDFFTGQKLYISLNFKNRSEPFEITATVVWLSKNGVGVRFIFETIEKQIELQEIIEDL